MSVREVCWYAGLVVDVIVDAVAVFFERERVYLFGVALARVV